MDNELCRMLLGARSPLRSSHLWETLPPGTQAHRQRFARAQLFAPIIFEDRLRGLLIPGSRSSGDV